MASEIKQIYKENFTEYLLCLALDVGEGLLKNGAEIRRVEDTIERICYAYGAAHVEVFSIISFIQAAIRMPDGSYSVQLRRVKSNSTDLYKLERFNSLSREICAEKPKLEEFERRLDETKRSKAYSFAALFAASVFSTAGFAFFFGGGVYDALMAAIVGTVIFLIDNFISKKLNIMAKMFISSFVASLIAFASVRLGIGKDVGSIIISSFMLLVPGLAFGSAIRDLLCGDLLSGTLKTLQSFLTSLMIALGYMAAIFIIGGAV